VDNKSLVLDLVEWVAREPRPYTEVMSAWRTSCPRLQIWEDALDLGLVRREHRAGGGAFVAATDVGREFLALAGRAPGILKEPQSLRQV
jgi:hypothetical protein